MCSRCQATAYCGAAHQAEDWKTHKKVCVAPVPSAPEPEPKPAPSLPIDPLLAHLSEAGQAAIHARATANPGKNAEALRIQLGYTSRIADCLRLIGEGADLNVKRYGLTALHENCKAPRLEVALVIASCPDVDIEARNDEGRTPLMAAARTRGLATLMTLLLNKGADINAVDNDGETALSLAITRSQRENVLFLIEKGADVTVALENPMVDEDDMAEIKAALLAHRGGNRSRSRSRPSRKNQRSQSRSRSRNRRTRYRNRHLL